MKKIITINLLVFISILLLANLLSLVLISLNRTYQSTKSNIPNIYISNPAFHDKDYAIGYAKDYQNINYSYHPYVGWIIDEFKSNFININKNGRRIVKSNNINNSNSINFFGGSSIWGVGSSDYDSIPSIIGEKFKKFNVNVYATPGHTVRQNLSFLINKINKKEYNNGDIIVFFDGVNDYSVSCKDSLILNSNGVKDEISLALKDFQYKKNMTGLETFVDFLDVVFLKYSKRILKRIRSNDSINEKKNICFKNEIKKKELSDYMIKNWRIAKEISDAHGLKFYSFIQPVANTQTNINHLKLNESLYDLQSFLSILSSTSEENRVDYIVDFTNIFPKKENLKVFIDEYHFNRIGNKIIADAISEKIFNN